MRQARTFMIIAALASWITARAETPVGTTFTYQGRLAQNGAPVSGPVDLVCRLFDAESAGNQIGLDLPRPGVLAADGLFAVDLDFGAEPFATNAARWLEIEVEGTRLTPRQPLTNAPFSLATRGIMVGPNGSVGIGTAQPPSSERLAVEGGSVSIKGNGNSVLAFLPANPGGHQYEWYNDIHVGNPPGFFALFDRTAQSVPFAVAPDGKIGVGTTSPIGKLSIRHDDGRALFFERPGLESWWIGPTTNGSAGLGFGNENDGSMPMLLSQDGNLGIGTASPNQRLVVDGSIATRQANQLLIARANLDSDAAATSLGFTGAVGGVLTLSNNGNNEIRAGRSSGGAYLRFLVNNTADPFTNTDGIEAMRLTNDGRVGIGTNNPQASLHVRTSGWPQSEVRFSRAGSDQYLRLDPDGGQTNQHLVLEAAAGDELHLTARWNGYFISGTSAGKSLLMGAAGREGDVIIYPSGVIALGINGNVGIGTGSPVAKLDVAGVARCDVLEIDGGADISEPFHVGAADEPIQAGFVVCIDAENPQRLLPCAEAYDHKVVGVISGAGGVKPGLTLRQAGTAADGEYPVALTGRVFVWCDAAAAGPIEPGDLLTPSATVGHAMRVGDHARANGAVLGKALTRLESGRGLVLTLVALQ